MSARVLSIDPISPQAETLRDAAAVLRAGDLVAFPTETVYGLGGLALSPRSLEAIFRAKGRPPSHPLIAHVLDEAAARALASSWPEQASLLAERFWPGPLTLVVGRGPSVPLALSGGKNTVAIRVPAHPVSRGLLAELGEPIAAPSANAYQTLSPTRAEHVARSLGERVSLILDGGPSPLGLESTVIDLTRSQPRVLRPGALPISELRAVLPDLVVDAGTPALESERLSPGQDAVHYAPRAVLVVLPRSEAILRSRAEGDRAGLVLRGPGRSSAQQRVLPETPEGFGRELFAALHDLDAAGVSLIIVEAPPTDEAWLAVRDRLGRASRPGEAAPTTSLLEPE